MKRNGQYWAEADWAALSIAGSFTELLPIALNVLNRMPKPIAQVCGPISTGGRGSIAGNLKVFDATIDRLIEQGVNVFDQVPFEVPMVRLRQQDASGTYNEHLLYDFYLPIFESGLVSRFYFIHDWQSSTGARWEREQAQRLGFPIEDLPVDFVKI